MFNRSITHYYLFIRSQIYKILAVSTLISILSILEALYIAEKSKPYLRGYLLCVSINFKQNKCVLILYIQNPEMISDIYKAATIKSNYGIWNEITKPMLKICDDKNLVINPVFNRF